MCSISPGTTAAMGPSGRGGPRPGREKKLRGAWDLCFEGRGGGSGFLPAQATCISRHLLRGSLGWKAGCFVVAKDGASRCKLAPPLALQLLGLYTDVASELRKATSTLRMYLGELW